MTNKFQFFKNQITNDLANSLNIRKLIFGIYLNIGY
jgi:hypothetical protein